MMTKTKGIIAAWVIALVACALIEGQTNIKPPVPEDPESLRQVLAHQPDYTAMQHFFFSEGFGGFGANSRVTQIGNRHVEVTDDTIFIREPGKATIKLFPKRKEFAEVAEEQDEKFAVTPEELAGRDDVTITSLGAGKVGRYDCVKIEVIYKDERLKDLRFVFWSAPALRNLIIKTETSLGPRVKFLILLDEVSLSVNKNLLRIPRNYKKIVEPDYSKELQKIFKPH
jgi:hypothetical protein